MSPGRAMHDPTDRDMCHMSQLNTDAIFTQQPYTDEKNIYGRKVKWPAKKCKGPSMLRNKNANYAKDIKYYN